MPSNSEIIEIFELTAKLLELHDENPFKIRGYNNAVFSLEKISVPLESLSFEEVEKIDGIGKGMSQKIADIILNGTTFELSQLIEKTLAGLIEMLQIKGMGPKKIRSLWLESGITTVEELYQLCIENKLAFIKGFGEKTQLQVKASIEFIFESKSKRRMDTAENLALMLLEKINQSQLATKALITGEIRRKLEVVSKVEILVATDKIVAFMQFLNQLTGIVKLEEYSTPFVWRGLFEGTELKVEVKTVEKEDFTNQLLLSSASKTHLNAFINEKGSLLYLLNKEKFESEEAFYENIGWEYPEPEIREGIYELSLAPLKQIPKLIEYADIKGCMHNHSTWSDGLFSIEEMALECKRLRLSYFGISDHSQTATYAKGLQEFRVLEQFKEIDALNQKHPDFKIFKGIESDILPDGALDYPEAILQQFDFIVASVHSGLAMDQTKATDRLLAAIHNPYTTMLGHPTGRLLLKREAYPIDYKVIIDACAAQNVIIEINASPWRLDLDWRWIKYATDKGVLISINPDAHDKEGILDMKYGVSMGRKGFLTKENCFNCLSANEVEEYFKRRKEKLGLKFA
jgi:DNA polymerase (family X)